MGVEIVPTQAGAGAEIRGVDIASGVSEQAFAEIEAALYRHGVVFFRDQAITPEQQVAFTRRFGEPEHNFNAANFGIEGSPEIYVISNIVTDGKPIGTRRAGERRGTGASPGCRKSRRSPGAELPSETPDAMRSPHRRRKS